MGQDDKDRMRLTVEAYLQSKSMNEAAEYVTRGRAYQHEDSSALRVLWIEAFKVWAGDHTQAGPMNDLRSELELRGEEPPYTAVKAEIDAISAKVAAMDVTEEGKLAVVEEVLAYARARNKPSA